MRIHDADYIRSAKRLYMTATPRPFDDQVKGKAASIRELAFLDEAVYGPSSTVWASKQWIRACSLITACS